jgi:hypothetical protein
MGYNISCANYISISGNWLGKEGPFLNEYRKKKTHFLELRDHEGKHEELRHTTYMVSKGNWQDSPLMYV